MSSTLRACPRFSSDLLPPPTRAHLDRVMLARRREGYVLMETREVAAQPAQGFIGSEVTLGIDRSTHRLTLRLLGSAEDRAANRWYGLGTPLLAETVRMIAAPPEVRFSRLLRRRLAVIISSDSPQVSPPKSP